MYVSNFKRIELYAYLTLYTSHCTMNTLYVHTTSHLIHAYISLNTFKYHTLYISHFIHYAFHTLWIQISHFIHIYIILVHITLYTYHSLQMSMSRFIHYSHHSSYILPFVHTHITLHWFILDGTNIKDICEWALISIVSFKCCNDFIHLCGAWYKSLVYTEDVRIVDLLISVYIFKHWF